MTVSRLDLDRAVDFGALFAVLPTPYVVLDPDLCIVAANKAYLSATGRQLSDLLGWPLFTAFPPLPQAVDDDGRLSVELALRRACARGEAVTLPVFRYDIVDQTTGRVSERHWMLSVAPVLDSEGMTALIVQRTEDLTDFVAIRERGRLAEQREGVWRERFEQVEADLFGLAQALAAALEDREAAAVQAAALADVALALVAAETLEDLEQELFARGLHALGADGGALVTADGEGRWRLAVDPALGEHLKAVDGVLPHDHPLPAVWAARTRRRLLLPTRESGLAFRPEMTQVYEDTQHCGWAFLPLPGGFRSLGSLALAWPDEHECTAAELDLLDGFAAQCAQAVLRIETAQAERSAVQQVRGLAEELQHALLTPPPEPDHLQIVVRYHAASGAEVGGDWYDAFQQPDGATMLVVGDVVGHDSRAAARMGQLRGVLRTLAYNADGTDHDDCAAVLTCTERTTRGLAVETLATAVIARIERIPDVPGVGTRLLRWSNAGHLPPVVLAPDGTSRLLEAEVDLMLGVDPAASRTEHTVELPVGHTLLLFTDGLIERRGEDLDNGLRALQAALTDLGTTPLQQLCDTLLQRLVQPTPKTTSPCSSSAASPKTSPAPRKPARTGPRRTNPTAEGVPRPSTPSTPRRGVRSAQVGVHAISQQGRDRPAARGRPRRR